MSQQQPEQKAAVKSFSTFAEFVAGNPQVAAAAREQSIEIIPPVAVGASLKALGDRAAARQEARHAEQVVDAPNASRKGPRA